MRSLLPAAALLVCFSIGSESAGQGCSQCRDTVSQTNPAQQRSYRDAIGIMLTGVVGIGGAGVYAIRRFGR